MINKLSLLVNTSLISCTSLTLPFISRQMAPGQYPYKLLTYITIVCSEGVRNDGRFFTKLRYSQILQTSTSV